VVGLIELCANANQSWLMAMAMKIKILKEKGKFCANTVYEQKKILLFGRRQQAILFHVIYTIFRFILFFL